uniref:Uncharacterized protein n=1 Tax=Anguilla anguilla TaxID=7936 RepID=A0A0E9S576_ANGAN
MLYQVAEKQQKESKSKIRAKIEQKPGVNTQKAST